MTTTSTASPTGDGLRQGLADVATMSLRELQHWRNRPGVIVFGWLFPVLVLAMFVGLLGGALGQSTGGSYVDFVMPGMLAVTMFFGLDSTMTAVSLDASRGVTERFRSLPVSGAAVLTGRCAADLLNSMVGLAVVVVAGLLFGWRPEAGLPAWAAVVGLLVLLRLAMLWIGMFVGLRVRSQEAVSAVQVAVWPLLMLSGVFVDTATMPRWLGVVAEVNPLTGTVAAVRDLLGAPGAGSSWVGSAAPWPAVIWPVLLTAVFLPLAAGTWRRLRR
ncbi:MULTISPECIES: ABC transporter permease [Prauserella salsuginis group]|uniref:Transport permease protein n=1 Tax=Prauserella salsuginis TaxID=387889 RepID=A0ABW6GBB2_9PSEU|nr:MULTISPECIES: ABC transporter permease [Prauserella salsuginis group]MCR3722430.1 ABC-2 type transport system permease protein [Prauserella flava]MCR3736872.1 ABC-2 type transport system permease protein [Prauserella salsuginis]